MTKDPSIAPINAGYPAFNVCLGKTLIAAAWVDGELNAQETECLKSLILQLPGITFENWRKLKIFMAYPIKTNEQLAIVEEFSGKVYLGKQRQEAWQALLAVLQSDGSVNLTEKEFAIEMHEAITSSSEDFLRKLKYFLFKDRIEQQELWPKENRGREKFINEFFDNPVYFLFRKAILKEALEVPQSKPELQKVCLFAAILRWLASVDEKITFNEREVMYEILTGKCGLSHAVSNCILDVALAIDITELQLSELTSSLADSTNQKERNGLFIEIIKIIVADDLILAEEIECLRTIALYLGISERTWVAALRKIRVRVRVIQ